MPRAVRVSRASLKAWRRSAEARRLLDQVKEVRMRAARCQTREISWIDETFTIFQRGRVVQVVRKLAGSRGSSDARELVVLDAGCYDGRLYWYMEQNHLFPKYVGYDVRADYIDEAERKVPPGRATFSVVDLAAAGLSRVAGRSEMADVTACLEVLEHLDDDAQVAALRNLFALTKVGGLVVVGTPVNTRDRMFHDPEEERNLGHVSFMVHEDLLALVSAWGHVLVEATPGWSLKSRFRIPRVLPEPWGTVRDRLGPAFRPLYLACMDEPNGGGFYVWRKRTQGEEAS